MGVNVCECVLGRVPGRACVFVFCWGEGGESGGRGQRKEERARPRPASNIIPAFLSTPLSPLATPAPSATTHTATTHTHTPAPCPPPPSACPPPPASPRSGGVGEPASPRSPPRPAPARTWRPTCVPGGEISWRCVPFFWFWGGGGGWRGRIIGPCVAGGCKEHASAMAGAMAAAAGEAELNGREKKKKKKTAPGAWTCRPRRRRRPAFRSPSRPGTVLLDIDHVHPWCRRAGRGGLPACRWGVVLPPPTHPPPPGTEKAGRPLSEEKASIPRAPPPKRGPSARTATLAPPPQCVPASVKTGSWGLQGARPGGAARSAAPYRNPFFSVDPRPFFLFPALFSVPRPVLCSPPCSLFPALTHTLPSPPLSPPPPPKTAPRRPLRRRGRPGRHHLLRPAGPGPGDRPVHHRRRHGGRPGRGRRPFLGRAGGAVREGNMFF